MLTMNFSGTADKSVRMLKIQTRRRKLSHAILSSTYNYLDNVAHMPSFVVNEWFIMDGTENLLVHCTSRGLFHSM